MIPLLLPPYILALASLYPLHHSLVPSLLCDLLLTSCHPPLIIFILWPLSSSGTLPSTNLNYTLVLSFSCSHCLSFPLSPLLRCPPPISCPMHNQVPHPLSNINKTLLPLMPLLLLPSPYIDFSLAPSATLILFCIMCF